MEKNDFMGYSPYDAMMGFDANNSDMYKDPMFNPMMQYEQGYMYYRYMCMQLEYRIKCKEYEQIANKQSSDFKAEKKAV